MAPNPERNKGVPAAVQSLSRKTGWYPPPAALILEPEFYTKDELYNFRAACNQYKVILIFDEIITGFRCGMGGLQKVHDVTPDLSCFGKSMANGMPISALVGKRELMKEMVNISYSGTFFGETLSLAVKQDKLWKKGLNTKAIGHHIREVDALQVPQGKAYRSMGLRS